VVILPLVGVNVGLKNWVLYAAKLVAVFKTVIAPYLAPVGTATVKLVSVALLTIAWVAPKNTMLLAAVLLKPVPVRVTVAPTPALALVGVKEVMVGTCAQDLVLKPSPTEIKIKSKICFIKVLLKFILLPILWFMIKCFVDTQL
jgi:hypothetical protein